MATQSRTAAPPAQFDPEHPPVLYRIGTFARTVLQLVIFPSALVRYTVLGTARGFSHLEHIYRQLHNALVMLTLAAIPFGVYHLQRWLLPPYGRGGLLPLWAWILLTYLFVLFLYMASAARQRVVVEEFADHTGDGTESVAKGLGKLLVAELVYLLELLCTVDEQRAIPRVVKPDWLVNPTIQVGDINHQLAGTFSAESKMSLGPFEVPVGAVMGLPSRIMQGSRIVGSLHRYGDELVITAQKLGGHQRVWRVERDLTPSVPPEGRERILHSMIRELACKVFMDLSSIGTQRWKALSEFRDGMELYRDCLRTQEDRKLKLSRAEKQFISALDEDDEFDLVYYNLGVINSELEHTEAAKAAFLKAIEKNAARWESHYALADAYFEEARAAADSNQACELYRSSTEFCNRVLRLDPSNARAHNLRGLALNWVSRKLRAKQATLEPMRRERQRLRAWSHADRMQAVKTSWEALCAAEFRGDALSPTHHGKNYQLVRMAWISVNNLGCFFYRRAESRKGLRRSLDLWRAEAAYRQAAFAYQPETTPYANLGDTYSNLGRHRRAIEAYTRATSLNPRHAGYLARVASAQTHDNRDDQVLYLWEKAIYNAFGVSNADVIRVAQECRKVSPQAECAATELADFLADLEPPEAEIGAHVLMYRYSAMRKKLQEHGNELRKHRKELMAASPGKEKQSLREKYIRYQWEYAQIAFMLGRRYLKLGRSDRARRYLQAWIAQLDRRAKPTEFHLGWLEEPLVEALASKGRFAEALEYVDRATERDPFDPYEFETRGEVYRKLGEYTSACSSWEDAHPWRPDDPDIHFFIGFYCLKCALECHDTQRRDERFRRADKFLNEAISIYLSYQQESMGRVYYWLGRLHLARKEHSQAVSSFRLARTFSYLPTLASYHIACAHALERNYDEAVLAFSGLLPQIEQEGQGRLGEPVDPDLREDMSYAELLIRTHAGEARAYVERGARFDYALRRIHQARHLICEVPRGIHRARCRAVCEDTQGWIEYERGDVDPALRHLSSAVSWSADPGAYLHLALSYELKSDSVQDAGLKRTALRNALEYCRHARELDITGEYSQEIADLRARLEEETSPRKEPGPEIVEVKVGMPRAA